MARLDAAAPDHRPALRTVGGPVLVVAAPGQDLPELPPGVEVVTDPIDGLGPMRGLATGLAALDGRAPVAFVCSTDLPFLHPALVRRVLREFADQDTQVVLPVARGFRQPLAAGYRTSLAGLVEKLLGAGNLRRACCSSTAGSPSSTTTRCWPTPLWRGTTRDWTPSST